MSEAPPDDRPRCAWCLSGGPLDVAYHDTEWGVESRDDRHLFEMLILEGAQAGLSWSTILAKRARYREVYEGFDLHAMSRFDQAKVAALLADPGIVRNRLKVEASITNARVALSVIAEHGSLAAYLWGLVGGAPVVNRRASPADVPSSTPTSEAMSKALRRRGFRFVGPTICYAFMQAVGMVDDHETACFRHGQGSGETARRTTGSRRR